MTPEEAARFLFLKAAEGYVYLPYFGSLVHNTTGREIKKPSLSEAVGAFPGEVAARLLRKGGCCVEDEKIRSVRAGGGTVREIHLLTSLIAARKGDTSH